MIFVKRIFAPDIYLRLRSLLTFLGNGAQRYTDIAVHKLLWCHAYLWLVMSLIRDRTGKLANDWPFALDNWKTERLIVNIIHVLMCLWALCAFNISGQIQIFRVLPQWNSTLGSQTWYPKIIQTPGSKPQIPVFLVLGNKLGFVSMSQKTLVETMNF